MKKNLLTLFLLLCIGSIHASDITVITGTWNRPNSKEVSLYAVNSGRLEPQASYNLQANGSFSFAFDQEKEGFYVIGTGSAQSAQNKYVFHFKPGDKLNVSVNDSTYTLVGKNTPENEAMTKWHDQILLLELRSVYFSARAGRVNGAPSTYVDFFPYLEEKAKEAETFTAKTGNKAFDKEFAMFRKYDLMRYAFTLILTPRSVHPTVDDYSDFYKQNQIVDHMKNTQILSYPFGMTVINGGVYVYGKLNSPEVNPENMTPDERQKYTVEKQDKVIMSAQDDTIKGELALLTAGGMKTNDQYKEFVEKYGKYIQTPEQQTRLKAIQTKIAQNKPATETIDFSGTDVNDKKMSLSDFVGKVVVVDVWATWCGPCKREIPFLKTMEKAYHGKDVVFLSISIDEVKDKQKWIDFVKKEELTGVQLFGGNGFRSDVAQFYKINSIPRFLVFDKKGQIISDNSPRPSEPALAKMVDDLLKK